MNDAPPRPTRPGRLSNRSLRTLQITSFFAVPALYVAEAALFVSRLADSSSTFTALAVISNYAGGLLAAVWGVTAAVLILNHGDENASSLPAWLGAAMGLAYIFGWWILLRPMMDLRMMRH